MVWEQCAPCWKSLIYIDIMRNHSTSSRKSICNTSVAFVAWSSVNALVDQTPTTCWGWLIGMVGMKSDIFQYLWSSKKCRWKNFVPFAVSLSLKNRCNTGMATKPSWKQGSAFSQECLKGYYQIVAQVGEIFWILNVSFIIKMFSVIRFVVHYDILY